MKTLSILAATATLFASTLSQAAMGPDYYENARSICQVQAHIKAEKRFPIDAKRAAEAKVVPVQKGKALEVTARDEANGKQVECRCTLIPGDADLYPAVRLKEPPECTVNNR